MDSQDDSVRLIRDALKAKQKKTPKRTKEGNSSNKADAISDEEINMCKRKSLAIKILKHFYTLSG